MSTPKPPDQWSQDWQRTPQSPYEVFLEMRSGLTGFEVKEKDGVTGLTVGRGMAVPNFWLLPAPYLQQAHEEEPGLKLKLKCPADAGMCVWGSLS